MNRNMKILIAAGMLVLGITTGAFAAERQSFKRQRTNFSCNSFSYSGSIVKLSEDTNNTAAAKANEILSKKARDALYGVSELCSTTFVNQNVLHLDYIQTVTHFTDRYISVAVTRSLKLDNRQIYNTKEGIVIDLLTGDQVSLRELFDANSDYKKELKTQKTILGANNRVRFYNDQFYITDTHLVLLGYTGEPNANGTRTEEYKIPLANIEYVMKTKV